MFLNIKYRILFCFEKLGIEMKLIFRILLVRDLGVINIFGLFNLYILFFVKDVIYWLNYDVLMFNLFYLIWRWNYFFIEWVFNLKYVWIVRKGYCNREIVWWKFVDVSGEERLWDELKNCLCRGLVFFLFFWV